MWVARFKLKDDSDIYSPLCRKFGVDFFAVPYTNFIEGKFINLIVGGVISGSETGKQAFINGMKKRIPNCS